MTVSMKLVSVAVTFLTFASCSKDPSYDVNEGSNTVAASGSSKTESKPEALVFKASGDITASLTAFRDLLGTLNTAPGANGGRREVNWDGVPADLTNNEKFPGNFFGAFDAGLPNGRTFIVS